MLSDEEIEDILWDLNSWFTYEYSGPDSDGWRYHLGYLTDLPQPYLDRVKKFISNHSKDELKKYSMDDLIKQATGGSPKNMSDIISKQIEIRKRRAEIEKDFRPKYTISYKELEQRLNDLNNNSIWFFMCLSVNNLYDEIKYMNYTDLLKLPKKYHQRLIDFFSKYDTDYSLEKNYSNISKFIKDSTGLKLGQFLKLVKNT